MFNLEVGVPYHSAQTGSISESEAKDAATKAANRAERYIAENHGSDFFGVGADAKYSRIFANKMEQYLNEELGVFNTVKVTNKLINLTTGQAKDAVYKGFGGC